MNVKPLLKKYGKYVLTKNVPIFFANNFEYFIRVEVLSNSIQNIYETGDLSFSWLQHL